MLKNLLDIDEIVDCVEGRGGGRLRTEVDVALVLPTDVGAHAQEIVGMPPEEGAKLLEELTAFCTQPQFVYSHVWRDGDAVMWDNRCTLHRATTFDRTKYKRKLHRTTIAGKVPDTAFAAMPGTQAG